MSLLSAATRDLVEIHKEYFSAGATYYEEKTKLVKIQQEKVQMEADLLRESHELDLDIKRATLLNLKLRNQSLGGG